MKVPGRMEADIRAASRRFYSRFFDAANGFRVRADNGSICFGGNSVKSFLL